MITFTFEHHPSAGEVYQKQYNDNIKVLVLAPMREVQKDVWFVWAMPIYPNGSMGAPKICSISTDDVRCPERERLSKIPAAVEALKRHRAIQRKARAAYVNDDTAEIVEGHHILIVRGI